MIFTLRFLRLISLLVWVGGIVFFAFVVAPVAFHNLPNGHEAGIVVRGSLLVLHWMGLVCGLIFLGATFSMWQLSKIRDRPLVWEIGLTTAMLALTLVSQNAVLPSMEADRQAGGGTIEALAKDDPRRIRFEELHVVSERLEGTVLLLGLGIVVLMARKDHY